VNCQTPDHDHWGTEVLRTVIQNIAVAYDSLHPGVRLWINDMSLEYGGLFDSDSDWVYVPRVSHYEYRIGKQVDIADGSVYQGNSIVINVNQIEMLISIYTDGSITISV
jgi:hypothetical protein